MKIYMMTAAVLLLAGCAGVEPAQTIVSDETVEARIVAANTAFAVDMYGVLKETQTGKNIFVSPASIFTAFGLAYAGAQGETEAEIAQVMHFQGVPEAEFNPAMGALLRSFEVATETATLSINNALWVDKQTVLEEDYAALTAEHYGASDFRVDYRGAPNEARLKINKWVEEKTNDRIKNLLGKPYVKDDTRAILVNTIYMDAGWVLPFQAEATQDRDFALLDGTDVDVPMMQQKEYFRHWQNRQLQALELPYQGGELSMVVVLPKREKGLPRLEDNLSASQLERWFDELSQAEPVEVDLRLPKIKLTDKYALVRGKPDPLRNVFPALGMTKTFSDAADFSGAVRGERQPDFVSIKFKDVIHQTFLEVDEKGTEAAAATALVGVIITSARVGPPPPPPVPFYADHPFLLLIKDNETGMVLFMGRVLDPRAE